jgi:5-formyltetrahydrofolate cyclo-ligase
VRDVGRSKQQWRRELVAARRALPAPVRAAEAVALAAHVRGLAGPGDVVCAHVPVGSEPGSLELLEALVRTGARVLLPLVQTAAPLRWAEHTRTEDLVVARFGLREPVGPGLEPGTIAEADVVLVPALAVDRAGARLGKGQGHYDRSLPLARPGARLVAVVRDQEVVDELPSEPHDVALGWALTPVRGLQPLRG